MPELEALQAWCIHEWSRYCIYATQPHLLAQHAGMTALGNTSCMLCNPLQAYMCTLHGLIQMIISLQGERSSTEMPHPTSCLRQEQPAIIPSGTLSGDARLFVWRLRWVSSARQSQHPVLCCDALFFAGSTAASAHTGVRWCNTFPAGLPTTSRM